MMYDVHADGLTAGDSITFDHNAASSIINSASPPLVIQNNVTADPLVNDDGGLREGSPCIDGGAPFDFAAYGLSIPVHGASRDIGCRESPSPGKLFSQEDYFGKADIAVPEPEFEPGKVCNILIKNLFFPVQNTSLEPGPGKDNDRPVPVSVKIVSLRGEAVKTLFQGMTDKNQLALSWDGKDETGEYVTPGVYFIHVRANTYNASRKIIFIR
jgi:hypothetical protein